MNSVSKNKKKVGFLDPRVKPQWQLLDLKEGDDGCFEHEFFHSVISEFTDIAGWEVEYWIAKQENIDHLYGEDPLTDYDGGYRTKLLYEPTNEQSLIDLFGFRSDETIQYAEMPKAIFERDVMEQIDLNTDIDYDREERKPRPGDVIVTLWDGNRYEITNVNTGERVFAGMKAVWSLVLKPFRINNSSDEESVMVFEELELDDFPEINASRKPKTLKQELKDNEKIQEESAKVDTYDDIDTSVYGYFQKKSK